ncbi:MAG TPA: DUF6282 family protein [Gaiella sp.]
MSAEHGTTPPSEHARELVRGGFDMHVHVAPDVVERRIDDVTLARRFAEAGLAGFVLKSHYTSTAERAAVVRGVVPETLVMGSITLNRAVGGMNALAVEIAAIEGARVVWLPTVDAVNETAGRAEPKPGQKLPVWASVQYGLRERGIAVEPVPVLDESGRVLPETRDVLATIAAHGMVLATGHLGRDEIFAVVDAAVEEGVTEIVVTHPEFPSQNLSADDQIALARKGALLERTLTTPHTGKVPWERWLANTRAAGAEHSVLATDLGQVETPPVEDGLALLADRLLDNGFDDDEVRTMAVANTRRLAGAVPA